MSKKDIGRLAMRVEGDLWVAYYALTGTMEGALFLGSVQLRFMQDDGRKIIFMDLMRDAVADLIEERVGKRPDWRQPEQAPEHERSGRS
jgi:hypothetical protein